MGGSKINIGILLPPSKLGGGVFQYALSIADGLIRYSNKYDYYIVCYDNESINWLVNKSFLTKNSVIYISKRKRSAMGKIILLLKLISNYSIFNSHKKDELLLIRDFNISLLIIPYPSLFGYVNNIPYIVSIPDLMHKYYPFFPEYPLIERLKRNIIYKYSSKHSVLTIVDDEQGIYDLNKFFRIPKDKIYVIPYIPPGYVFKYRDMDLKTAEELLKKYNLPEKILFYPAQFWYHKNHIRLIKALKYIKQSYGLKIPLVLVGSPKESYKMTMNFINESNMRDQVIHLGYVSDEEIVALYKRAYALVYPSLFGPTNIPPLEAMVLGTPVVCSNLFSMPKQVGDAGLLFDPFNIEDIAEKIYIIWTDENLRKELVKKGYERVKNMTLENYAKQWEQIIDKALGSII